MSNSFTIELSEELQQSLINKAAQRQLTLEQLIVQTLHQHFLTDRPDSPATQQILSLIGTLDLGTTDLAEQHDQYLGKALHQELRNAE
jgi:hypothetical protein